MKAGLQRGLHKNREAELVSLQGCRADTNQGCRADTKQGCRADTKQGCGAYTKQG